MKRKRSFLLLEVVIAIALIGLFTFLSTQAVYASFKTQQQMIQAFEKDRLLGLVRMELIEKYWDQLEEIALEEKGRIVETGPLYSQVGRRTYLLDENVKHQLTCKKSHDGKRYLLKMQLMLSAKGRTFSQNQKPPTHQYICMSPQSSSLPTEANPEDS